MFIKGVLLIFFVQKMLTEGISGRSEKEMKNIPPRSISTPFHYHSHGNSNAGPNRFQNENSQNANPSFLDKLTPEELDIFCEMEKDQPTDFESELHGFVQKQKELNHEAMKVIDNFTDSLRVSKDFIPYLQEASSYYHKASEIKAHLEAISQFPSLDSSKMTPENPELF